MRDHLLAIFWHSHDQNSSSCCACSLEVDDGCVKSPDDDGFEIQGYHDVLEIDLEAKVSVMESGSRCCCCCDRGNATLRQGKQRYQLIRYNQLVPVHRRLTVLTFSIKLLKVCVHTLLTRGVVHECMRVVGLMPPLISHDDEILVLLLATDDARP